MSEGDSIHHLARRLRPALMGSPLEGAWNPGGRTRGRRWDRQLRGASVVGVTARGKHLLIRTDNGLVVHNHLGMSGSWLVRPHEESWPRPPETAWVVLRRAGRDVAQFGGPFLLLRTRAETLGDPRLRRLGPDLCVAREVDVPRIVRRLRDDDGTRPVGDAFLDQRTMAGVGNVWKVEVCWALGIHPLLPLDAVTDDELAAMVRWIAPRIQRCGRLGTHLRPREIYGRAARPCPRCRGRVLQRGSGDDHRPTYWCADCQPWRSALVGRDAPLATARRVG
ncbi:DNA-formamidopyrimidine glycosylase family protein [Patulibacter sp.]|uniref:DNA-formamidopyrimidine glycosylase family protein n=1 Tax=Patulibacter sp. TaxID=1912859 RepID=UPI00271A7440|nr:DNA-formamidopyrimidine glycosylase family protein [Patulibacter sp.]MDO9410196.1 DNA-formamidopyrimidine glycosylase family protein [Patulibacter sp.]